LYTLRFLRSVCTLDGTPFTIPASADGQISTSNERANHPNISEGWGFLLHRRYLNLPSPALRNCPFSDEREGLSLAKLGKSADPRPNDHFECITTCGRLVHYVESQEIGWLFKNGLYMGGDNSLEGQRKVDWWSESHASGYSSSSFSVTGPPSACRTFSMERITTQGYAHKLKAACSWRA